MFPSKTVPVEMEILFKALGSKDPDKRYHALMEAQELTSQQLMHLVQASKQQERRSHWRNTTRLGIVAVMVAGGLFSFPDGFFIVCTLGCVFVALSDFNHPLADEKRLPEIDREARWNGALRPANNGYEERLFREMEREAHIQGSLHTANNWHEENLLRVMERAPDSRCVEAVLWMLGTAQGTVRARLLHVLQRRLPEVRTDEAREWTALQQAPLLTLLRFWHGHTELVCAILKAMPKIGGTWALETVERLVELKQWETERVHAAYKQAALETAPWEERDSYIFRPNPATREMDAAVDLFKQIGNAAAECLPGLRERAQEEEASRVLLRASAFQTSADHLLRPAADKGAVASIPHLLRSSTTPTQHSEKTDLTPRH